MRHASMRPVFAFLTLCAASIAAACSNTVYAPPVQPTANPGCVAAVCVELTGKTQHVALSPVDGVSVNVSIKGSGEIEIAGSKHRSNAARTLAIVNQDKLVGAIVYITFTAVNGPATLGAIPGIQLVFPGAPPQGTFRLAELENNVWTTVGKPAAVSGSTVTFARVPVSPAIQLQNGQSFEIAVYTGGVVPTPTPSPSPTPSGSPTPTPSSSPTPTPSASPTPTPSASPTPTPHASPTPTRSPSPTPSPTSSPTPTPRPTATPTPIPAPALTSVSPSSGTRGTVTHVTLTGTSFIAGSTVSVAGNVAVSNVVVNSSTKITADFLGGTSAATGAHNVTVTTTHGTSNAKTFTINPGSMTFNYTGGSQSFVVPSNVTQIAVQAAGAQGNTAGGQGGSTSATLAVTPSESLTILVAGAGPYYSGGGFPNGGSGLFGGGGASMVSSGATMLIVAGGGGGGGGGSHGVGGPGGCTSSGTACNGGQSNAPCGPPSPPGQGATQSGPGAGGTNYCYSGLNGSAGVGSTGGTGGNCTCVADGGGGGGGYFGGGGGAAGGPNFGGSGGGGGSSFAAAGATNVTFTVGTQSGNGQIVITW